MSLAGRLEDGPPKKQPQCTLREIVERLPEDEASALLAMVHDPKWSDAKTFDALREEGVTGLPDTDQWIGKHRRRRCGCP